MQYYKISVGGTIHHGKKTRCGSFPLLDYEILRGGLKCAIVQCLQQQIDTVNCELDWQNKPARRCPT